MAKRKPDAEQPEAVEGEVIYDFTAKHKIQVRLEDGGPKKRDGRRGVIVLEDPEAPESVVRWLKSPTCKKSERGPNGRRQAYLWVDDAMVPTLSVDVPDADAEPEETAPGTGIALQQADHAHQAHLAKLTRALEQALEEARERQRQEVAELRKQRDEEIKVCNLQIKEARERLALELQREADELEQLAARRAQYGEERASNTLQLAKDVELTATTRAILSRKMLAEEKTWVGAAVEALKTPQGQLLAVGIAAKLGVSEDLLEMALGVAQAVKQPPGAPETPPEE
jgi:hypothetical protein